MSLRINLVKGQHYLDGQRADHEQLAALAEARDVLPEYRARIPQLSIFDPGQNAMVLIQEHEHDDLQALLDSDDYTPHGSVPVSEALASKNFGADRYQP